MTKERKQEIKSICKMFEMLWSQNPELRFTQIVSKIHANEDIYYKTDTQLLSRLRDLYEFN